MNPSKVLRVYHHQVVIETFQQVVIETFQFQIGHVSSSPQPPPPEPPPWWRKLVPTLVLKAAAYLATLLTA